MAKGQKKDKKPNRKWKRFKDNLYLKGSLLRIWSIKNIKTFIIVAVLVYAIVILTGNATGGIIFGGLSSKIDKLTSSTTVGDALMNTLAVILSLSSAVLFFWKRTRHITLGDIKSKKLKLAMIKAGLYFDDNGRIRKKANKTLKVSVDENGKVVEPDPVDDSSDGVISSTVSTVEELGTILTSNIKDEEDYTEVIDPALEAANKEEDISEIETNSGVEMIPIEDTNGGGSITIEEDEPVSDSLPMTPVTPAESTELTQEEKKALRKEHNEKVNTAIDKATQTAVDVVIPNQSSEKKNKIKEIVSKILKMAHRLYHRIIKAIKNFFKKHDKKEAEKAQKVIEDLKIEKQSEKIIPTIDTSVEVTVKEPETPKTVVKETAKATITTKPSETMASTTTTQVTEIKIEGKETTEEKRKRKQKEEFLKKMNNLYGNNN